MDSVRVIGAGSFVPERRISNARIAKAIPGWSAERILEKVGIEERRFLWDFDTEKGVAIPPPEDANLYPGTNTDMCEVALRGALKMANLDPRELDALFVVTCTPDELNFSHDAMALHHRLGCREDTFALVNDDGCGGTPYTMDLARKMIEGGTFKTIAIVGSAFTSPLLNREVFTSELARGPGRKPLNAYLSMYVFGDGAGAIILQADPSKERGIVASMSGNASGELVIRRGGGQLKLAHQGRAHGADFAFVVDGMQVARSYPVHMKYCLDTVTKHHAELVPDIRRYYFHQPNKRLMDRFVQGAGLPADRVACHVHRYGNTSAAGMLILLAEDLADGTVSLGSGELVVIAAVGANVHFGAQLIRL